MGLAKLKTKINVEDFLEYELSSDTRHEYIYGEEPILIVEVISPSTERTDRNEKLAVYKNIPTLQEYVIVWQDKMYIELPRRQADNLWLTYIFDENDLTEEIEFQSVDLKLTLDEIYRRVKFEN